MTSERTQTYALVSLADARKGRALACASIAFLYVVSGAAWCDAEFEYAARIEGVSNAKLRATLEGLSDTLALQENVPGSLTHLRRRAERDKKRFLAALRAEAYYAACVSIEIDSEAKPISVVFRIETGPAYRLQTVHIAPVDADATAPMPEPVELGLVPGEPALSRAILNAEKKLVARLKDEGYPFPNVSDRKVVVDHGSQTVDVTYNVTLGRKAVFGPTRFDGLESVKESVVRARLPWREGDAFEGRLMQQAQKRLYETGLFALVRIEPLEEIDSEGRVPIHVEIAERKHRTIGAGIQYRTDEGLGTRFIWEHRNIRRLGRRLTVDANVSETVYDAEVRYRVDQFRREDQSLLLSFEAGELEPEAFTSTRVGAAAWVERELRKTLVLGAGLAFRFGEVEQFDRKETYQLLSAPVQLTWDRTDYPLDPGRGFRLTTRLEPFADVFGGETSFLKAEVTHRQYYRPWDSPDWVLAGRLRLGASAGGSLGDIPADERFYAGGSTSIRGYPYQTVGPLIHDDPVGGRSVAEVSVELRRRLTKTIGLVGFVDGGTAFKSTFPDFGRDPRWGAGLGLRYFTPIGPLRLDVAVPLNRRDEVDDAFQLYISIGQAF